MRKISSENTSFNHLRGSGEFLNNISNCVLLLNQDINLRAFNDAMKTMFSNKLNEHLIYRRCREAIGHTAAVEEQKDGETTSKCGSCKLTKRALRSYVEEVVNYIIPTSSTNASINKFLSVKLKNYKKRRINEMQSLQDNVEKLRITLNFMRDAMIVSDAEGCITLMNLLAEKLTGWMFYETKGKPLAGIFNIVNTQAAEQVDRPVKKGIQRGESYEISKSCNAYIQKLN